MDGDSGAGADRDGLAGDGKADRDVRHPRIGNDGQGDRLPMDVEIRVSRPGCGIHQSPGTRIRSHPAKRRAPDRGLAAALPAGCRQPPGAAGQHQDPVRDYRRRRDPCLVGARAGMEAGRDPRHRQRSLDQHRTAGRVSRAVRRVVRQGSWLHADRGGSAAQGRIPALAGVASQRVRHCSGSGACGPAAAPPSAAPATPAGDAAPAAAATPTAAL